MHDSRYKSPTQRAQEAQTFISNVRSALYESGHAELYHAFLDAMRLFRRRKIDVFEVISIVGPIIQDHTHLIAEFSKYIPRGFVLIGSLHNHRSRNTPTPITLEPVSDAAAQFIANVRQRDSTLSQPLTRALRRWQMGQRSLELMYTEVVGIFNHHPDLLSEFHAFMTTADRAAVRSLPLPLPVHQTRDTVRSSPRKAPIIVNQPPKPTMAPPRPRQLATILSSSTRHAIPARALRSLRRISTPRCTIT